MKRVYNQPENSETFELEELRIVEEGDELTPLESFPLPFSLSRNAKMQPASNVHSHDSSQNIISSSTASSFSISNQHQMSSRQTSSTNRNGNIVASCATDSNPKSAFDDFRVKHVSANSGIPTIKITEAVGENVVE